MAGSRPSLAAVQELTLEQRIALLERAVIRLQTSVDVAIELSIVIGQGMGLAEKMAALVERVRLLREEQGA